MALPPTKKSNIQLADIVLILSFLLVAGMVVFLFSYQASDDPVGIHIDAPAPPMTDSNLNDLCPQLQALVPIFLANCLQDAITVHITVTWRDPAAQNAAAAAGLSKATDGQSPHNCVDANGNPSSMAFDFACFRINPDTNSEVYITDGKDQDYALAGQIAEALGLEWGGRFTNFPDYDHIQIPNWNKI